MSPSCWPDSTRPYQPAAEVQTRNPEGWWRPHRTGYRSVLGCPSCRVPLVPSAHLRSLKEGGGDPVEASSLPTFLHGLPSSGVGCRLFVGHGQAAITGLPLGLLVAVALYSCMYLTHLREGEAAYLTLPYDTSRLSSTILIWYSFFLYESRRRGNVETPRTAISYVPLTRSGGRGKKSQSAFIFVSSLDTKYYPHVVTFLSHSSSAWTSC